MDTETRELSSVSRGKIRPQETDDWKNEKLFVPPLPPTNLRGCHLIRIQYDVFVSHTETNSITPQWITFEFDGLFCDSVPRKFLED